MNEEQTNIISSEKFINQTINYLNSLIRRGIYSESVDELLDMLINEIKSIENLSVRQSYFKKLENKTIKCKRYKDYKNDHNSFYYLESTIKYENQKRNFEVSMYDIFYNIIVGKGGLVFYDKLLTKYPYLLDLYDKDCNSIFLNIAKEYIERNDEYLLTVVAYFLEKSTSSYKSEINKLRKIIREKKQIHKPSAYKLEKIINSYYPNNTKEKQTSLDKSYTRKPPYIKEHLKHGQIITPYDYKDRESLLDYMSFGLTNSKLVENSFYVDKKENGKVSVYHHISDVSDYLYNDSKMESDAEKQLFMKRHSNHTGSLFNPVFLREYASLNPGSEKLAITIRHDFDELGNYKGSYAFRSAIYIGPVFKKEDADECIYNLDHKDLLTLYKLTKNLTGNPNLSPSNTIIKGITSLSSDYIKKMFIRSKTPGIYKDDYYIKGDDSSREIKKYLRKKLDYNTYRDYENLLKKMPSRISDYTVFPEEESVLNIDAPFRNYLDYKNLKILDDLIKKGKLSKGAINKLREELIVLTSRANAVNLTRTKRKF